MLWKEVGGRWGWGIFMFGVGGGRLGVFFDFFSYRVQSLNESILVIHQCNTF